MASEDIVFLHYNMTALSSKVVSKASRFPPRTHFLQSD